MLKEHSVFITILALFSLLIVGATIIGLNTPTGHYVRDIMFCEPLLCSERGLEAARFYCDKDNCYRDCYQEGYLIKKANFCEKAMKLVE